MRNHAAILVATVIGFAVPALPRLAAEDQETITLRVRFLIPRDLAVEVRGERLTTWLRPAELRETVLPEVNRIWRQAGVRFEEESIVECAPVWSDDHERVLGEIAASGRDEQGRSDRGLLSRIRGFFPSEKLAPAVHNVLLFPYLGKTLQGNAVIGGNLAVVGLWSDKASRGRDAPHKVLLSEPEPFRIGSLGRTVAHELGHGLGLEHPAKTDPILHRLMGGKKAGYLLTAEEIEIARAEARRHAEGIFREARQDRP